MWIRLEWKPKFEIGVCLIRDESEALMVKVKLFITLSSRCLGLQVVSGLVYCSKGIGMQLLLWRFGLAGDAGSRAAELGKCCYKSSDDEPS